MENNVEMKRKKENCKTKKNGNEKGERKKARNKNGKEK